jgi:acyl-CoA synthetase (AMP-forming)/AMP-acid ligase II
VLQNPLGFLLRAAHIYPEKLALVHPDAKEPSAYTYEVFTQRVCNLAYALIEAGIQPGDRVAVIAPNWCEPVPCHRNLCTHSYSARSLPVRNSIKPPPSKLTRP